MKCFIFTFFIFSLREILSFKPYGDYYIENEGYIPAALMSDPISYEAGLTRTQYNKLIVGKYYFSRKVGPIGLNIALKRESDGTRINEVKIKNVCTMDYPLEPFTTKFSGIIDGDCCIEKGNYTLTNWSLEEHMRPQIKSFWYGKFIANLRFMENKEVVLEQDLVLVFKDRDLKKLDETHVHAKDVHRQESNKKRKKKKGKPEDGSNPLNVGEDINPDIGENLNSKTPKIGEDVNSKVPKANVPKIEDNMNPKVPNVGEDVGSKLGEGTNPKVPKVGGSMSHEVPKAGNEMAPKVPNVGDEMTPKVPNVRQNKKRRPKRVSPRK